MSGLRIKMIRTVLIATLAFTVAYHPIASAQDATTQESDTTKKLSASEGFLKDIRDILFANINKLPLYLNQLTKMAISWLAPDNSKTTAELQNNLTRLANTQSVNAQIQLLSQKKFLDEFLDNPASQDTFPNVNDLCFETLLNKPYFNPDTRLKLDPSIDPAYNYTVNASGLNLKHFRPSPSWNPNDRRHPSIAMYIRYYNTASAVQTYNGYVLSELYAESKDNNLAKQTQNQLIQQANDSNWFTQIASENLGIVLRQILLYNSQTYVLLAQLLETQKKLLVSQTMNNALLIAVNQEAENRIYSKASGQLPI